MNDSVICGSIDVRFSGENKIIKTTTTTINTGGKNASHDDITGFVGLGVTYYNTE